MTNTKIDAPLLRLLVEERRRLIVDFIETHGRGTVEELAVRFGASTVTIRSDLKALAHARTITRSHGGALPVGPAASDDAPLHVKEMQQCEQKIRIGKVAAQLICDGETIILDSGSTVGEIARQIRLRKFRSLTVITNALNVAFELRDLPNIRVMMLGGMLRQPSCSLVGPEAERVLEKLSADRLFLGLDGLDPTIGATTPDPLEASLNALMIRVSREVVAVMDASKLGRRSLSVIAPVQAMHTVITDVDAPRDFLDGIRSAGVKVILS